MSSSSSMNILLRRSAAAVSKSSSTSALNARSAALRPHLNSQHKPTSQLGLSPLRSNFSTAAADAAPAVDQSQTHGSYNRLPNDHELEKTADGAYIVDNTPFSLEWVLTSPPPLHAFLEPPIMVEWPEGEGEGHH